MLKEKKNAFIANPDWPKRKKKARKKKKEMGESTPLLNVINYLWFRERRQNALKNFMYASDRLPDKISE